MLRTAFFTDFKSAETLLLWGGNADMLALRLGVTALRKEQRPSLCVEGGPGLTRLHILLSRGDGVSRIDGTAENATWSCSWDVLSEIEGLIEPLTTCSSGHQYVDTQSDFVEQVMIAANEYSEDMRR